MMDDDEIEDRAVALAMWEVAKAEVRLRKRILDSFPTRGRGRPPGKSKAEQPTQSRMAATRAQIFQQRYLHEQAKLGNPSKRVPAHITNEAIAEVCRLFPKAKKSRVRELVRLKVGRRAKVFD
jgi:hypothetical protein